MNAIVANGAVAAAPAEPAPLSGNALRLATVAVSLATFMQVLDTTIANVSIPTIAGNLGVSPNQGTWVITSFAVANGIAVPLTGWLSQRYGPVRTFVMATLLFTIASWLCGLAWSLSGLIAFRVLQGAVSGPMIPLSQALLLQIYPPQKRGLALALWGMTTLVAPICGPLLGGWISDNASWPWIFYMNVPVGLFAAAVTWNLLKDRDLPGKKLPIDRVGLVLLVVWVGALQIMLDKGRELDWFESTEIVALGIVSIIGFLVFLVWELTERHPIVDLTLFKSRNFTVGAIAISLGYGIFFGNVVLLPLWLQTQLAYTATWAGLVAAPTGVMAILISPMVGNNLHRVDPRLFASFSFAIFATCCFMRSDFTIQADVWTFALPQVVQGAAMAMFFVPLIAIGLSGFGPDRIPSASGMTNFLRITAGSFAASITTTIWDDRAALHQTHLAEASSVFDPKLQAALANLQATGLTEPQALSVLGRTLNGQAYFLSAIDYFYASGFMCLGLIAVVWLAKRPKPGGAPAVAAD